MPNACNGNKKIFPGCVKFFCDIKIIQVHNVRPVKLLYNCWITYSVNVQHLLFTHVTTFYLLSVSTGLIMQLVVITSVHSELCNWIKLIDSRFLTSEHLIDTPCLALYIYFHCLNVIDSVDIHLQ